MKTAVLIAIASGCIAGAFGSVWIARLVVTAVAARLAMSIHVVRFGAIVGGGLALFPSFFASFVIGGNLGGGWGEVAAGMPGVVVGLGVGIALVLALGVIAGSCAGALLTAIVSTLLRKSHAP
jgi:hypothetical protein